MTVPQFLRHYRKVEKLFPYLKEANSFTLHIQFAEQQLSAENRTPRKDITTRLAILMRRFLNSEDRLHLSKIWTYLQQTFPEDIPAEAKTAIDQSFEIMSGNFFPLHIDDEVLTPEKVYHILSDGHYFQRQEQMEQYLNNLITIPIVGVLFWHSFYQYTLAGVSTASLLNGLIKLLQKTEKYQKLYHSKELANSICIFCLASDGGFSSEEHIIPESLGNDELILSRGVVCNRCNGELSKLDAILLAFEPVAFLQMQFVQYTKEGKLPKARFQNVHFERESPTNIVIKPQDRTGEPQMIEDLGGGLFTFKLNMRGKKINIEGVARALYKIGLELVAHHIAPETARSDKYNTARDFVMKGGGFNNNLLIHKVVRPEPTFQTHLQESNPGTLVSISLYGLQLAFNLEEEPQIILNEVLEKMDFDVFPLSQST